MLNFSMKRALFFAQTIRGAYTRAPEELNRLKLDAVDFFSISPVGGMVGSTSRKVFLTFRGCSKIEPCDSVPEHLRFLSTEWANVLSRSPQRYRGGIVSGVCLAALNEAWDQIEDILLKHEIAGKELWLTGHGLGGCLAILMAAGIMKVQPEWKIRAVYTFGSPRVGDRAFAAGFSPKLYRFEAGNDIMPHFPPQPWLGDLLRTVFGGDIETLLRDLFPTEPGLEFVSFGDLKFIDWEGRLQDPLGDSRRVTSLSDSAFHSPGQIMKDHDMTRYFDRIWTLAADAPNEDDTLM